MVGRLSITSTDTTWRFDVTVKTPAENSYVCVAVYDEDGNLCGIHRVPLDVSGAATAEVKKTVGEQG